MSLNNPFSAAFLQFPVEEKDFNMLMAKKNLVAIYEHLFTEGVIVAMKDVHAPKHPELEKIPNLHVNNLITQKIISEGEFSVVFHFIC